MSLCLETPLETPDVTPELKEEFEAWERAGDEAWTLIDEWEAQGP